MRPALEGARKHLGESHVIGVEVGVLRGENSREILSQWDSVSILHLVDNYCENNAAELDVAKRNIEPWKNKVVWHLVTSVEAAKKTLFESRDFVYIDAGHDYENVMADMNAWWPKIRHGGVLCGHDYQFRWESMKGLVMAVNEFSTKNSLELNTDTSGSSSDWWIIKK